MTDRIINAVRDTIDGPRALPVIVHKEGEEGAVVVDFFTGLLISPINEQPDWCEGISAFDVAERTMFYAVRLSENDCDRVLGTRRDAIEFADLSYSAIDAEGHLVEVEADSEYRMAKLADIVGMNRPDNLSETVVHTHGTVLASGTIAFDADSTIEEVHAMERAQDTEFPAAEKTGTEG